jgi:hypothetical protein
LSSRPTAVFASGDQSKRDLYRLEFRNDLAGIRAIRLDVLPDDRLPNHGPGRVYYEGPAGDFFLSEVQVTADGKPIRLAGATSSWPKANSAAVAIDGDPQSGWSVNGGQGRAHSAVFRLGAPLQKADVLVGKFSSGISRVGPVPSRSRPTCGRRRLDTLQRSSCSC